MRLTRLKISKGVVQLSDRTIDGLLAVAVFAPANAGQRVPDGYFLALGDAEFTINDWCEPRTSSPAPRRSSQCPR